MAKTLPGLGTLGVVTGLGGTRAYPASGIPTVAAPAPAPPRPPRPSGPPRFPRGPALLGLGHRRSDVGGPGIAPAEFILLADASAYEWIWYWASAKWFHDPPDPRRPPFTGARSGVWQYQQATEPGDPRAEGNSISDFLYHLPTGDMIVRIDTWYFHTTAGPQKQAQDVWQTIHAGGLNTRVERVYDFQFVGDGSGKAAIAALRQAIAGEGVIGPGSGGTAFQIRDAVERPPLPTATGWNWL
jgi:hypothetical protein